MKKFFIKPYEIDIEYEKRTYKYVGQDYENTKHVRLKLALGFSKFLVKVKNKRLKEYSSCNTYTEWENHVKEVLRHDIINKEDLVHWLYRKRNKSIQLLEAIKAVLIPIYIALLSVIILLGNHEKYNDVLVMVLYGIFAIIIAYLSAVYLKDAYEEVDFYNDFIRVAEKELLHK